MLPIAFLTFGANVGKILVSKQDHSAFCCQERQFIQLRQVQLTELNSMDFCPDCRRDLFVDHSWSFQQERLLRVCP